MGFITERFIINICSAKIADWKRSYLRPLSRQQNKENLRTGDDFPGKEYRKVLVFPHRRQPRHNDDVGRERRKRKKETSLSVAHLKSVPHHPITFCFSATHPQPRVVGLIQVRVFAHLKSEAIRMVVLELQEFTSS